MELLLHQLEQNLSQAAEVSEDLLAVSRSKQEAILCADIEGLEQAVTAEAQLIEAAQRTESVRLRIHHAIALQVGIAPEELNLDKLVQSWTFHDTTGIEMAHARLKAVVEELRTVTGMNNHLADISLKLIGDLRRAVLPSADEQTYYGRHGEVEDPAHGLALVDLAG